MEWKRKEKKGHSGCEICMAQGMYNSLGVGEPGDWMSVGVPCVLNLR
jgi:hypothetical protein